MVTRALAVGLLSLLPLGAPSVLAAELVVVQQGELPIILTVPHGGRQPIPGIAPRDITGKPGGGAGFVTGGDVDTDKLARGMAAQIKALTGKAPYLIAA